MHLGSRVAHVSLANASLHPRFISAFKEERP